MRGSGLAIVTRAVEHYNRMVRVLEKNRLVKVALDIQATSYDEPARRQRFQHHRGISGRRPGVEG